MSIELQWTGTEPVWLAGVDGCPAGWLLALARYHPGYDRLERLRFVVYPHFEAILSLAPAPAIIAVDMPIGLLDTPRPGGRDCDQWARRLLRHRSSSITSRMSIAPAAFSVCSGVALG